MNKYYLMPTHQKLSLPHVKSPLVRLEEEIQQLNRNAGLNDEQRWAEYEKLFNSFFSLTKPQQQQEQPQRSEPPTILSTLESTLPKSLQQKGRQLMQILTTSTGNYGITANGQLQVDGQIIPNSNLVDLINYSVRQQKRVPPPPGWSDFKSVLSQLNIPQEFLAIHHRSNSLPKLRQKRIAKRVSAARKSEDDPDVPDVPDVPVLKPPSFEFTPTYYSSMETTNAPSPPGQSLRFGRTRRASPPYTKPKKKNQSGKGLSWSVWKL